MEFKLIIDWILILRTIMILLIILLILYIAYYYYKKSGMRILILNKENYYELKPILIQKNIDGEELNNVISDIYKDVKNISIDKDTYIKKSGSVIKNISSKLDLLSENILKVQNENINLKNRSELLQHKEKLLEIIILLDDVRKFKETSNTELIEHIESNLVSILISFGVKEYSNEFYNDEFRKFYIFDKEYDVDNLSSFIVKKSGFYLERVDGQTVIRTAVLTKKEN